MHKAESNNYKKREAFLSEVRVEFANATNKYGAMHNPHEAYAIIKEELDEYWDEVKKQQLDHDPIAMRRELVQVATMCLRAVHDLELGNMD